MSQKRENHNKSPFEENRMEGVVMHIEPDAVTGLTVEIWIPYTQKNLHRLHEGDIVAATNFNTSKDQSTYALMEIMSFQVVHAALAAERQSGGLAGAPTFRTQIVRNMKKDLVDQVDSVDEDTTQIVVTAQALNKQLQSSDTHDEISSERSPPMIGSDVKFLRRDLVDFLINGAIIDSKASMIELGPTLATLSEDEANQIRMGLDAEQFVRTHFGIFGFTGAGKSNLLNNIVRKLLTAETSPPGNLHESSESVNVVLVDIMDEYKTLLLDKLIDPSVDAVYAFYGDDSVPGPVKEYLQAAGQPDKQAQLLENAAQAWLRTFLFPRSMQAKSQEFLPAIRKLLEMNRVKSILVGQPPLHVFWDETRETVFYDGRKSMYNSLAQRIEGDVIKPKLGKKLDATTADELCQQIEDLMAEPDFEGWDNTMAAEDRMKQFVRSIRAAAIPPAHSFPEESTISMQELIRKINNSSEPTLQVMSSESPDELRRVSTQMAGWASGERRRKGNAGPTTSFIFDEADEFLPSNANDTQKASKRAIEQLARRGRKFGLGVGIATQRIAYLDTNSMSQLNTYFISKLPRKVDRDRIAEGFSLGDDAFHQTFTFNKGDWLAISHSAAGIDAVPMPVHMDNSETKLLEGLKLLPKNASTLQNLDVDLSTQ